MVDSSWSSEIVYKEFQFPNFKSKKISGDVKILSDFVFTKVRDFPVFMGCVDGAVEDDVVCDMYWGVNNGLICVEPILPPEFVYQKSHNDATGETWNEHNIKFAMFIEKFAVGKKIYELGGGSGIIQTKISKNRNFEWFLHDINPIPVHNFSGKVIRGFFDGIIYAPGIRTIIHSHTLEHVNDQIKFINQLATIQAIGDTQIISFPDFNSLLENNSLNMINFEHNKFLPLEFAVEILEQNGYRIEAIEYFKGHSIFVAATKIQKGNVHIIDKNYFRISEFNDYVTTIQSKVNQLNDFIKNDSFLFFGAHIFTQILMAFGVSSENSLGCLDNSPLKKGKRLYGTELMVFSPIEAEHKSIKVIGAVGVYKSEVYKQLINLGYDKQKILFV